MDLRLPFTSFRWFQEEENSRHRQRRSVPPPVLCCRFGSSKLDVKILSFLPLIASEASTLEQEAYPALDELSNDKVPFLGKKKRTISDEDGGGGNRSSSADLSGQKPKVEELEMLLEAYFAQLEGALSKLSTFGGLVASQRSQKEIGLNSIGVANIDFDSQVVATSLVYEGLVLLLFILFSTPKTVGGKRGSSDIVFDALLLFCSGHVCPVIADCEDLLLLEFRSCFWMRMLLAVWRGFWMRMLLAVWTGFLLNFLSNSAIHEHCNLVMLIMNTAAYISVMGAVATLRMFLLWMLLLSLCNPGAYFLL
ncbi:hypothetical protein RHGRI_021445 [Rhododendron griersonianum]|uniref:Uncharacterized protein n=1 Tax=Rhododendron griersonianum TaxID=479676 RepID=A0AAV6JK91_9ERIC|nr:hypothetical protein RHGRI_021445 [Rhododendron griersonianum]